MQRYNDNPNGFEGFETFANALRMRVKMHARLLGGLLILQTVIFVINATMLTGRSASTLWLVIGRLLAGNVTHPHVRQLLINWVVLLVAVVVIPYPTVMLYFRQRSRRQSAKHYIRGARLVSAEQINAQMRRRKEKTDLPLGSINMPIDLENRHTYIIGKPGVGKTQLFRRIVKRFYARGVKGIIYDNKGEYLAEFYRKESDLIFNPLDSRSLGWNIFNELKSYPDVDAVAASLIPPASAALGGNDPFWNDAARGVFSGILHYLYQNRLRTNADLWRMLTAEPNEISQKLKVTRGGEAGYRYITQNSKNSKQAESVLAVMMQYTKCFEYMAANHGDFQIHAWLRDPNPGMIYITNYEDIEDTLRPVLSLFVDLAARKLLSLPNDLRRRVFIGLDEFGTLQRLSAIINLLTRGRSKGACVFVGVQDDGQIEKIYSSQLRKTIDNACGNRVTFALTGETAEKEARYNLGEVELAQCRRSYSMGANNMRGSISLSEEKKRDLMLLPSDIANLQDLTAIVRLRNYDFTLSKWQWEPAQQIHPKFLLRQDLLLEDIIKQHTLTVGAVKAVKTGTVKRDPAPKRSRLNIAPVQS